MFEIKGNLFDLPADVICITTNGFVKKDNKAVMGRGCALEAKNRYPGIDKTLGDILCLRGNHVSSLLNYSFGTYTILSFPVKHNWWEEADLDLIERSAVELVDWINLSETTMKSEGSYARPLFVAVPRPGCGNGKLKWENVKPICEKYFDNRFGIVTYQ